LTVALPEFRLRLQALPPKIEDDQKFVFVPKLLKLVSVLRLPDNRRKLLKLWVTVQFLLYS